MDDPEEGEVKPLALLIMRITMGRSHFFSNVTRKALCLPQASAHQEQQQGEKGPLANKNRQQLIKLVQSLTKKLKEKDRELKSASAGKQEDEPSEKLRQEVSEARADAEQNQERVKSLEAQVHTLQSQLDQERAQYQSEKDDLIQRMERSHDSNSSKQSCEGNVEIRLRVNEHPESREKLEVLKSSINRLTTILQSKEALDDAERDVLEAAQSVDEHIGSGEENSGDHEKIRQKDERIQELERERDECQKCVDQMKKRFASAAKKKQGEIDAANEKIAELQRHLESFDQQDHDGSADIASLREQLRQKDEQIRSLENQVEQSQRVRISF